MSSIGVTADYRPVRVGWCVRHGSREQIRRAMRLSTMLWGGRFNPILPVDRFEYAEQLCELFHVDVLYPMESDKVIQSFVERHAHISWPRFAGPLLLAANATIDGVPRTALLDVGFAIDAQVRARQQADSQWSIGRISGATPTWSDDDVLADVLLAAYGAYPEDEWGKPLCDQFTAAHGMYRRRLEPNESLPGSMLQQQSPLELTRHGLWSPGGGAMGAIFVGSAASFDDIVSFWNLSAANHDLVFYDPAHHDRIDGLTQQYIRLVEGSAAKLSSEDWRGVLEVWSSDKIHLPASFRTSIRTRHHLIKDALWNGLNERPRRVATENTNAVASITRGARRPSMTFQLGLPEIFHKVRCARQLAMATIRPYYTGIEAEGFTFAPPNVPELNEYYSREMFFNTSYVRVEANGLGVITEVERPFFNIHALSIADMFQHLFQAFGMAVKPSHSGTIARRLIQQMGGLQSCRVFKIAGVRRLIETFRADKAFSHRQAIQQIGPGFSSYRGLYIQSREKPHLEPNDAFLYLLDKQVFRAGLTIRCPTCELEFWVILDNAATMMECEYCGARFNSTTQLRDRDAWAYRRSGLFGRDDHQEGAIPVTLVLQRLDTSLHDMYHPSLFSTALQVQPLGADVPACEIDFVFLTHGPSGRPQLILGEAKNRKEIEAADVRNVDAIKRAFPVWRMDVFPTFAKLAAFTEDELTRCLESDDTYPKRHILLSAGELEPYDLYERFGQFESALSHVEDAERIAEATQRIYRAQLRVVSST